MSIGYVKIDQNQAREAVITYREVYRNTKCEVDSVVKSLENTKTKKLFGLIKSNRYDDALNKTNSLYNRLCFTELERVQMIYPMKLKLSDIELIQDTGLATQAYDLDILIDSCTDGMILCNPRACSFIKRFTGEEYE